MRPSILLLVLCGLAGVSGHWVWKKHLESMATSARNAGLPADSVNSATQAVNEITSSEAEKKLKAAEEQNRLLKEENEKLRAAVMAQPSTKPDPANDARVDTSQPHEVKIEKLITDVENIRGLKFKRPLQISLVPTAELESQIRKSWQDLFPAEQAAIRQRVVKAFGLCRDEHDIIVGLTGLAMEQHGGHYDDAKSTLYIDKEWDLTQRPDLRSRVILEIARALLIQNFEIAKLAQPSGGNDDAALAARALLCGDAALTKLKRFINDQLLGDNNTQVPPTSPFYGAPPYLRQQFIFPYSMAEFFSEVIQANAPTGSDDREPLNRAFARPPRSTTEVMHLDLYTAETPFTPTIPTFPTTAVAGKEPLFTNTWGEFNTLLLLKTQLAQKDAMQASEGWAGDRYMVYEGPAEGADQYVWKTIWRSEADAQEFAKNTRMMLMHQNAIPWKPAYDQADGGLVINDPQRILRVLITADKKGVNIINAGTQEFADAAQQTLLAP